MTTSKNKSEKQKDKKMNNLLNVKNFIGVDILNSQILKSF